MLPNLLPLEAPFMQLFLLVQPADLVFRRT